jgi:hypothetical protein
MEPLNQNQKVKQEIVKSLQNLERDELVEILSHLIKVYVIESNSPFRLDKDREDLFGGKNILSFIELIYQIKKQYHFPELEIFKIDDRKVTINLEGKAFTIKSPSRETKVLTKQEEKCSSTKDEEIKDLDASVDSERFKKLELE